MLKHTSVTSHGVLPVTIILGTRKPEAFLILFQTPGQSKVKLSIGWWPVCWNKHLASFHLSRLFWVTLSPFISLLVPSKQQLLSFREKLRWWQTVAVSFNSWPRLESDFGWAWISPSVLWLELGWSPENCTSALTFELCKEMLPGYVT